ncbi:hypothetical protein FMM05_12590 [Flavobacterium zepuense]|uniref:Calcineurin-like phosphoesterase domain-containing protein n=1 Tax=Flavobacterium zepuense TaxID=2593302 RepID=A0A552V0K2_9FLAO|nr:metallophosphoesterase [Flavobacterium zepuense]TRW23989.1 hypothetical protein FMM05_12590 [Flavobacterium zepuense]
MHKVIAFITDTHLGDTHTRCEGYNPAKQLDDVLNNSALQNATHLVFAGDITEPQMYPYFFNRLHSAYPNYKAILGNHDKHAEAVKHCHYKSASGTELYYSEEDEFYKYIYLDSSSSYISESQLQWLEQELDTSKKIVIFIHHPILAVATGMDSIYPLKNRDALRTLLHQLSNDVTIFCGHYHMPDKQQVGNIVQYITPATSFQVKKASDTIEVNTDSFGYRIITLKPQSVTTQLLINRNGTFEEIPE